MNYLLYGHGGAYNHGAEAIVRMTIEGLHKIDEAAFITLSTHFPEQDKEFAIPADCLITRDTSLITKEKENGFGSFCKEIYGRTIDALKSGEVALSVGGDNYCYESWRRWAAIHEELVKKDIKDILWSCSINPEMLCDEMLEALRSHTLITARESITYRALREKGLDNVLQCADVAYLLQPKEVKLPESFILGNMVAVNVSPLLIRRERIKGVVTSVFKSIMDDILRNTDMGIVLVPHVVMPMDNDYEALKGLYDLYEGTKEQRRIWICSGNLSVSEYKYIISKCRFGLFARTHATIAAYSSGVPSIALGYSVKAEGIAKDMGVGEFVLPIEEIENSLQLKSKFHELIEQEECVRNILRENRKEMEKKAKAGFEYLNRI